MPKIPDDPPSFIRRCIREGKIYWTYHVNMRLAGRFLTRDEILNAVDSYEIIEPYPEDKYLPSYLVLAATSFHASSSQRMWKETIVRIVTAYRPDPNEWESDLKTRRSK